MTCLLRTVGAAGPQIRQEMAPEAVPSYRVSKRVISKLVLPACRQRLRVLQDRRSVP
ncbi:MAG: hypothetical protein IT342_22435 [Candidatus Melainabacteria bacterium]|nr:hypothetical protein [Candidatus Melainabacteria bacterium]